MLPYHHLGVRLADGFKRTFAFVHHYVFSAFFFKRQPRRGKIFTAFQHGQVVETRVIKRLSNPIIHVNLRERRNLGGDHLRWGSSLGLDLVQRVARPFAQRRHGVLGGLLGLALDHLMGGAKKISQFAFGGLRSGVL